MILNSACLHICVYTLHIIIYQEMIFNIIPSSLPSPAELLNNSHQTNRARQPQSKITNNPGLLHDKKYSHLSLLVRLETALMLASWALVWSLIIVTTAISVISSEQGAECGLNGAMHNYPLSGSFTSHKANRPLYPLSTTITPPPSSHSNPLSTIVSIYVWICDMWYISWTKNIKHI